MATTPPLPRGARHHLVFVEGPSGRVPDGDGDYTDAFVPLDPPTWRVQITPAAAADLERSKTGAAIAQATHVVIGDFHPMLTTAARLVWTDVAGRPRTFAVTGVSTPDERGRETIATCVERVP